jgi:DegV family protein with EDD domain
MSNIGIVIDSTCSVSDAQIKKYQIEEVPVQIIVEGTTYYDRVDATTESILALMDQRKKVTTSQPSPEAFAQKYRVLKDKGFDAVVVMTISGALSGTYQSAVMATELVEGIDVEVIDTKSSSMIGDLVMYHIEQRLTKNMSVKQLAKEVREEIKGMRSILTINNLDSLYKTGRLTRSQAFIGNALQVKPMIITDADGKMELADRIRSTKKAMEYLATKIRESIPAGRKPFISIGHISAPEKFTSVKEALQKSFPQAIIVPAREISPVVAVHLGKGGYGICWMNIKE